MKQPPEYEAQNKFNLKMDFVVLQRMMRKEGTIVESKDGIGVDTLWLMMPSRAVACYHGVYNRRRRLSDKQTALEILEFPILSQGCDSQIATIRLIPAIY